MGHILLNELNRNWAWTHAVIVTIFKVNSNTYSAIIAVPIVTLGLGGRVFSKQESKPPVIDTMGEIRLDYPMSLITEILGSGNWQ